MRRRRNWPGHHGCDCAEGLKGGRGSAGMSHQDKGTGFPRPVVLATALGVAVRLRNFAVFILKKRVIEHGEDGGRKTRYFDAGSLFWVPWTPPGTEGSPWHGTDGSSKSYLCFTSLQPENTSQAQGEAGSTRPQKAAPEVTVTSCP